MRTESDDRPAGYSVPAVSGHSAGAAEWAAPTRPDLSRLETAIDFRRLRYFVQIVIEGSFSTAALRLHVAQPALSHHVRELETTFGLSLLTRSAHGVAPTAAGRCLYDNGVAILRLVRDAAAEVSAFSIQVKDYVTFGLETSMVSVLAAPLIEFVRLKVPDVQLRIVEGTSVDIREWLDGGRLDIALMDDVPSTRKVVRERLLTEVLYLVGRPGSGDGDVLFCEASHLPLILPGPRHGLRHRLEREAEDAKSELNVTIEIDSLPEIKKLVRSGLGYSVLPASAVYVECEAGHLAKRLVVAPVLEQTLYLYHAKGRAASQPAARVRRLTLQLVGDLIARSGMTGAHGMD